MRSIIAVLFALSCVLPAAALPQRDYFTPEEIELVRQAQAIDARIGVLTHAIDRRFAALNIDVGAPKLTPKEQAKQQEKWGALPNESRNDLLIDIKRILQKAVDDIDDVAAHDSDKESEKNFGGTLLPKAVRELAAAARRYEPVLKSELQNESDQANKGSILDAIDLCDEIQDALAKLPAEAPKPSKKH